MKKLTTLKINGEGWNGLVAQFRNGENIDLLRLVEKYPEKYPYFLESSSRGNIQNRYSIIFFKPKLTLIKDNENIDFLDEFNSLWKKKKIIQYQAK